MIDSTYSRKKGPKKNFLELAYEKKLEKYHTAPPSKRQAKQHRIGSIHNRKVNYDVDECFFVKEDIPEKAKTIKQEIKDIIDPDYLGMKKKEWNTSVAVPKNPELEQDHQRRLLDIRIGLDKKPFLKFTEKELPPGTETRNNYTGWNVSTYHDRREHNSKLPELTRKAITCTKNFMIQDYHNPVKKAKDDIDIMRQKKISYQERLEEMVETIKFKYPEANEARVQAEIFKMIQDEESKKRNETYHEHQSKIQRRVNGILAKRRRLVSKKEEKDNEAENTTKVITDSEVFSEFEDHEAKLQRKIRKMQDVKKNKKKKQTLQWMYGNF